MGSSISRQVKRHRHSREINFFISFSSTRSLGITDSQDQIIGNQFLRKTLAIQWQRTAHPASAAASSTFFSLLVQKAIALLMPFNMQMSSNMNAFSEMIPLPGSLQCLDPDDGSAGG